MSGEIIVTIIYLCFSTKQSAESMKTILFFTILSLIIWFRLCLTVNQRNNDEGKVFHEILDRVKKDVMPQVMSMHFYFGCIYEICHATHGID